MKTVKTMLATLVMTLACATAEAGQRVPTRPDIYVTSVYLTPFGPRYVTYVVPGGYVVAPRPIYLYSPTRRIRR
jgi:hypothetical protein